jgi:hypothetical protein
MVANGGQISQVLQEIAAISQRALADAVQGLRASALEALEAQPRLMLAAGPVASGALDVFTEVASAFQRAHAPGTERGDVWAVVKSGDLEAAERLIKRWRPWPYDRRAQGILKKMPFSAKMSLLEKLPQDLVDETTRLKREPRRWRDNRVWLKENGRPAEITVRELTLTFFVRQLRTIALKVIPPSYHLLIPTLSKIRMEKLHHMSLNSWTRAPLRKPETLEASTACWPIRRTPASRSLSSLEPEGLSGSKSEGSRFVPSTKRTADNIRRRSRSTKRRAKL